MSNFAGRPNKSSGHSVFRNRLSPALVTMKFSAKVFALCVLSLNFEGTNAFLGQGSRKTLTAPGWLNPDAISQHSPTYSYLGGLGGGDNVKTQPPKGDTSKPPDSINGVPGAASASPSASDDKRKLVCLAAYAAVRTTYIVTAKLMIPC